MKKKLLLSIIALFGITFSIHAQCVQCDGVAHLGTNASRMGTGTSADGHSALSSGYNSSASGNYSTALGYNASSAGLYSVAIGRDVSATGSNSFIIGSGYSSSSVLTNNISKSIMFGVNSSTPTMIIRQQATSDVKAFVGIGTTDPKKLFHVNGNTMISGSDNALLFATSASSTYGDFGITYNGSGLNIFKPNNGSPTNNLLFVKDNGNIGVGTGSPTYKLHVAGSFKSTSLTTGTLYATGNITFSHLSGSTTKVVTIDTDGKLSSVAYSTFYDNLGNHTASQNIKLNGNKIVNSQNTGGIFLDADNNVGVGTLNPKQMLHIVGGNILISRVSSKNTDAPGSVNGSILFGDVTTSQYPYGAWGIEYMNDNDEGYGLNFWKTYDSNGQSINNVLFLSEETAYKGNVGIGTSRPKNKLSVNGNIQAKELVVTTLANDWPDYVFDTEYKLTNLHELDRYLENEKHLPGVPSAKEIDEDGIKIGEMNTLLLQKVEELTLYIIELQKQIDELKGSEN